MAYTHQEISNAIKQNPILNQLSQTSQHNQQIILTWVTQHSKHNKLNNTIQLAQRIFLDM